MNYIEIMGPQAVGKTALTNLLISGRKKNSPWKTYQESVYDIVDSLKWNQLKNLKSRLLYFVNKCNFTSYKRTGICNTIMNELTDEISCAILKRYEYLMDAQFKSIESLSLNIASSNKYSLLSWHWKALNRVFILETLNYKKTVLLDEGPMKTHYGLENINANLINRDTLPAAIIYCTISKYENIQRIKKRFNTTGRVSKIHNELNNEELTRLVIYTHETAERNFNFLTTLGVPSLKVDLSISLKSSELEKIHNFLDLYSSTNSVKAIYPAISRILIAS